MDLHLKEFLLYLILSIITLPQWTNGDVKQFPKTNTIHLQGNQITEDKIGLEPMYDDIFRKTASKTEKTLSETALDEALTDLMGYLGKNNAQNITSNKMHSDGPVFVQDIYRVSLLETSDINTVILHVEAKDNSTTLLKYTLLGQHSDYFHMDPLRGIIVLAKPLEFNTINKYALIAKAMDKKGYSSRVPVHIDIKDVDTMNPHFIYPLYEASVLENHKGKLSTHPKEIKAIDGDIGINETVTYNISNVHPAEYSTAFFINTFNGVISLIRELDREAVSSIRVYIKATQQNNHLKSADSVVLVTILDENDNPPQFSQSVYEALVPEHLPPGSQVLLLKASDKDEANCTRRRFSMNEDTRTYCKTMKTFKLSTIIRVVESQSEQLTEQLTEEEQEMRNSDKENKQKKHLEGKSKENKAMSGGYFTTNDTKFRVDKKGVMYLSHGEIDRELTTQIFVKVWVFDTETAGQNSSTLIIITVTDVNDNNPEFENQPLFFTVPEGDYTIPLPLGEVNVIDQDAGLNGQTTVTSENKDIFIVQKNGIILVNGSLDRETKDRYVIFLIAADNGMPPRKSFADLVVAVQDVNDNAPTFTQSVYSVHLTLSATKTGDSVLVVSAKDLDIGKNSQISYRFSKPHHGFTIDEQSGVISRTSNIPAVCMESSNPLIVIATDHGVPILSSNATVLVTVTKGCTGFLNSSYNFSTDEGMPPGTEVGTVQFYTGPDLLVMYSLETYTDTFSITDNGTIITSIMLNREDQDSYSVMVKAVDTGEPPSTGAVVVVVTVRDMNDNVPVFSPVIHKNVICQENENFLDLGLIRATDKDNGNNGSVTYMLKNDFDGIFHIDNSTGQLSNYKPLDREKTDSYELTVIAQDSGTPPLLSRIMICVTVQDVDDNPPIFEQSLYEVTVKENEAPYVILNVSAADADTGDNALIMYSFTKVSSLFHIGETSGSLFILQPLDFEASPRHVIMAIAYSPRNPQYWSTTTVIVHVEDVNEQGPRVENIVYHAVIWDSAYPTGSAFLDINATHGNKSVDDGIHYSISDDNSEGLFAISNDTGHIFAIKDLPPHRYPQHYAFTVNCRDNGIPPLSASVMVFVALSPINISYPVFSSEYYCPEALNDWTAPDTILTQIRAFYLPGTLLYSFTTERDKDYFCMDPLTGIIRTKKILVMKDFPRNVTVKATDSQRFWIFSEAIVHVDVIHRNQWAPVFPNSLVRVKLKEDQKIPTLITQVQASDADTDRNGVIQYSILNNDVQNFSINAENGKIFALSSFDFEIGPREFQIFILAEDQGLPQRKQGYCTIVVHVLDINDNKPIFGPINDMVIKENPPVDTFVGQVMATDKDSGDNAFIIYSLYDEDGLFEIDEILGNIFVKGPLDYETNQKTVLNITATNNKTAPFYETSTLLTVHILDENDNAPQFNQKQYFAELDVDSLLGTLVTTVNASDRDQGNNCMIEYFLSPDIPNNCFMIENVKDGRIITAGKLNPGEINITVFVKDKGSPSLNSSASVILNVIQKDDPYPTFNSNELSTDLKKNEISSSPIYTFSAKNTSGHNITYRIVDGNEGGQFYLDENTGELWATDKFNYDDQPFYTITVEADMPPGLRDPLLKNIARLQINLPDIHKGPIFEKQNYNATVLNTLPRGFPIIKVTAKEPGLGPNEMLVYSLVNQSVEEFAIDNYTGQIKSNSVAGKNGTFHIEVQAMDPSGLFKQTIVQIRIESPSLSRDNADIKINQTLREVERHIEKIKKVLEKILKQKVKIEDLSSKDKETTIRVQTVEKTQKLVRKLEEDISNLQKKMEEIFHKPVDVTVQSPQTLALSPGTIAGIVVLALVLCGLIAFFIYMRRQSSDNATDEETGSVHDEDNHDKETPSNMPTESDSGVPKIIPATVTPETQAKVTVTKPEEHQDTTAKSGVPKIIPATVTPETQAKVTVTKPEEHQDTTAESGVSKIIPEKITPETQAEHTTLLSDAHGVPKTIPAKITSETQAKGTVTEPGKHQDIAPESGVPKVIPEKITPETQTKVAVTEPEEHQDTAAESGVPKIIPEKITPETQAKGTVTEPEEHQDTAAESDVPKIIPATITPETQAKSTVTEPEEHQDTAAESGVPKIIPEKITPETQAKGMVTESEEHQDAAGESGVPKIIPEKITPETQAKGTVTEPEEHQDTAAESGVPIIIPEKITPETQAKGTVMEPEEHQDIAAESDVPKIIPATITPETQAKSTVTEPEEHQDTAAESGVPKVIPEKITPETQTKVVVTEPEEHQDTAAESGVPKEIPEKITPETQPKGTVTEPEEHQDTAAKSGVPKIIPEKISPETQAKGMVSELGEHQDTAGESGVPKIMPVTITPETQVKGTLTEHTKHQETASESGVPKIIPATILPETQAKGTVTEPEEHQDTAAESDVNIPKSLPEKIAPETRVETSVTQTEEPQPTATKSEAEPSDDKNTTVEKKEQPVQEPGDEFVETWESYESEEDSVTDSTKAETINIPQTSDTVTPMPLTTTLQNAQPKEEIVSKIVATVEEEEQY